MKKIWVYLDAHAKTISIVFGMVGSLYAGYISYQSSIKDHVIRDLQKKAFIDSTRNANKLIFHFVQVNEDILSTIQNLDKRMDTAARHIYLIEVSQAKNNRQLENINRSYFQNFGSLDSIEKKNLSLQLIPLVYCKGLNP